MKKTIIRTAAAIIAVTGLVMPFTGVNAWDLNPAVKAGFPVIEPVGPIKITPTLRGDVEIVSERIVLDGTHGQGASLWIYLTVRNGGALPVNNIRVQFNVNEFLDGSARNIYAAPENLLSEPFTLGARQTYEVAYRLSSFVWFEANGDSRNYHYRAEILNVTGCDTDLSNNCVIRLVDRTSGTESL